MMTILVTGGAGFIGSNFLNLLGPRNPAYTQHSFGREQVTVFPARLGAEALARAVTDRARYRAQSCLRQLDIERDLTGPIARRLADLALGDGDR